MTNTRRNSYGAQLPRFNALIEVTRGVFRDSKVMAADLRRDMMAFVDESSELAKGAPRTLAGLQQLERDLLHYFKVGAGADVEEFWRRASAENLELVRKRDVVVDTLRRGRVLNMDEYAALEDAFEEIQMCGKIDGEQADRLNEMLDAFSRHPDNLQYFEDEEA